MWLEYNTYITAAGAACWNLKGTFLYKKYSLGFSMLPAEQAVQHLARISKGALHFLKPPSCFVKEHFRDSLVGGETLPCWDGAGAGRSLQPGQNGGWQDFNHSKPHHISQAAPSHCVGSWFPSRRKVPGLFRHPKIHLSSRLRVLFFKLVMSDSLTTASSKSKPKL